MLSFLFDAWKGFTKEVKRLYALLYPYFGLTGDNLKRTIAVGGMIVCNVASALAMVFVQDAFAALSATLLAEGVTYAAIVGGVAACFIPVGLFAIFLSVSGWITLWLSENLESVFKKNYSEKLMDNHAHYGMNAIKKDKIDFSAIVDSDLKVICAASMQLMDDYFQ